MNLDLTNSPELVIFTTRDFARLAGISVAGASKRLARLRDNNASFVQITRGIWANTGHPYFNVLACVPVLLGSEQGYVSFLSALHIHGALAQIPAHVQVATTGHARRLRTPVATFELLQIKPEMMLHGVKWSDSPLPYRIATVEKALLDTFYISTRRKRRFVKLPELQLRDAAFNRSRYLTLLAQIKLPPQIEKAMQRRWDGIA